MRLLSMGISRRKLNQVLISKGLLNESGEPVSTGGSLPNAQVLSEISDNAGVLHYKGQAVGGSGGGGAVAKTVSIHTVPASGNVLVAAAGDVLFEVYKVLSNNSIYTKQATSTPANAFSSSNYTSGYDAPKAFDGDKSTTRWRATDDATMAAPKWLGYQFASPVAVQRIVVKPYGVNGFSNGKLQYSDDGANWVDAVSINPVVPWSSSVEQTFNSPNVGAHKYWRLYMTTQPAVILSLTELEFFTASIVMNVGRLQTADGITVEHDGTNIKISNSTANPVEVKMVRV